MWDLPASRGTRTIFHPDGSKVHIERRQDVEPILDRNKREQNEPVRKGNWRRVGRIPVVVLEKVANEMGIPLRAALRDQDKMQAILLKIHNDPDYAHLRTAPRKTTNYVAGAILDAQGQPMRAT